jgi:membrane protease YdiL (CAAX protease family)
MPDLIFDNLVGILLASLAAIVVAGAWYSPIAFGKLWRKEAKIKDKELRGGSPVKYIIALVMILLTAVILQQAIIVVDPQNMFEAASIAVWIWLGFIVTYVIAGGLFEKVSTKLMLIDLTGQVFILMAMSATLYAFWA